VNHKLIAPALALILLAPACTNYSAREKEQREASKQLADFLVNQPIPSFPYSQLRQNLIEIETAQANSTATTAFFFNQGVADPIMSCPSIGFPIPSTYQLTNPWQNSGVAQLEATGVYTGDSSGTYVICIDGTGTPYAMYWEGFVSSVSGPAQWVDGQVVLTGKPSVEFSTGQP